MDFLSKNYWVKEHEHFFVGAASGLSCGRIFCVPPWLSSCGWVRELQVSVVAGHWLNCARMWDATSWARDWTGSPGLHGGILTTGSPGKFCMNISKACHTCFGGFPGDSVSNDSTCNAGDTGDAGSIPGSGRCPGGGCGNPLRCSCLENPMDREGRQATVNRVKKSQTQLQRRSTLAAYMFSNCFLKALCQPMVNRYFLNPYYAVGLF